MTRSFWKVYRATLGRDAKGRHNQAPTGEWEEVACLSICDGFFDYELEQAKDIANAITTDEADDYAASIVLVTERTWTTAYPEE